MVDFDTVQIRYSLQLMT